MSGGTKRIMILGAGIGGLATGILLARAGHQVTIIEQNSYSGGKASEINIETTKGTFRFDKGPSLGTMYHLFQEFFEEINENIEDYIPVEFLDNFAQHIFADNSVIQGHSNPNLFAEEIGTKTSDSPASILNFLNLVAKRNASSELFINTIPSPKTLLSSNFWQQIPQYFASNPLKSMHSELKTFFKDERTRMIFSRYATYAGSNPFQASLLLNSISHIQHNLPVFFPKSGIRDIPLALEKIATQLGCRIVYNNPVERIIPPSPSPNQSSIPKLTSRKSWIVETQKETYSADLVVSNIDVHTTQNLLPKTYRSPPPLSSNLSTSGIVFYLAIQASFPQLKLHNVFFPSNYEQEFTQIFQTTNAPQDPSIYLHISSKIKKDDAPKGCENWFMMINMPSTNGQWSDSECRGIKNKALGRISNFLNVDISKLVLEQDKMTPYDLALQTGSYYGSLYGSNMNKLTNIINRTKTRSRIPGLYYSGGSSHPGGGMPLVLKSAKHAFEAIKQDILYGG